MSSSAPPPSVPTRLVVAGLTDVGRQRKHNEDCVLLKPNLGLFAVADGMGGHNAGDVASKLVAQSLGNYFEATASGAPGLELPDEYAPLSPDAKRLAAGVRKANLDVFTVSHTHAQHHGMGSTCVAIHIAGGMAHIAHVGDSRCYRIRDGQIVQLTRDHSLINDALDMKPDLTKEELSRLPKNIITRALGMKDVVKVDVKSEPFLPGDTYLLCSDGLTGMVPPEQILEVISLAQEPQEACELLIAEANDAGGTDNISALLVHIEEVLPETDTAPDVELVVEDHHEIAADQEVDEEDEALAAHTLEADQDEAEAAEDELPPDDDETPLVAAYAALDADDDDEDEGTPTLQVVATAEIAELPSIDDASLADLVASFQRGDPMDVDLHGPWNARTAVRRCPRCAHELYQGNSFCTECGTRIETASA
ncbi:Protein serine/threonine phosphatase PrpC, regulation of stationary phase [Minicystis rosea]|nr:Protein serine/threonine phosphatase PrpC, regulation of stationary phase [Minicystis rosea]